jgi:hypothetical protein
MDGRVNRFKLVFAALAGFVQKPVQKGGLTQRSQRTQRRNDYGWKGIDLNRPLLPWQAFVQKLRLRSGDPYRDLSG